MELAAPTAFFDENQLSNRKNPSLTLSVPLPHPLHILHQYLGTGGCGAQLQMLPDRLHPLLPPLDLKADYVSFYRPGNRLELRPKRFRLAEDIRQVR